MQFTSFVKSIRDIMRRDPGISGDAHRIEQLSWMIFLAARASSAEMA